MIMAMPQRQPTSQPISSIFAMCVKYEIKTCALALNFNLSRAAQDRQIINQFLCKRVVRARPISADAFETVIKIVCEKLK